MGVIYVDDINLSEVAKYEAKLADCQRKLLAAADWANMFQKETECLKAKLDSARKEDEKHVAAAKVVSSSPGFQHQKRSILCTVIHSTAF
jgi:hypothetical protein